MPENGKTGISGCGSEWNQTKDVSTPRPLMPATNAECLSISS